MLARWKVVDDNFILAVKNKNFPRSSKHLSLSDVNISLEKLLDWFDSQIKSRHLDIIARELKEKNQGFYTIGSSGHEGNVVLGDLLKLTDTPFLHYRSGAFYIHRAKKLKQADPLTDIILSLVSAKTDPICSGRHKVFGSKLLNIPPQTSTIASHLPKAVGAALSIGPARTLNLTNHVPADSIVLCSFGDASFNHATAQGAINLIDWTVYRQYPVPLVLVCEDNGIGVSTATPKGWINSVMQNRKNIIYLQADGLNLLDSYQVAKQAIYLARIKRKPVFLHLHTVRLLGHAGSDIETHYWSQTQIALNEAQDPLLHSARIIIENNYLSPLELLEHYQRIRQEIQEKAKQAVKQPKLSSAAEIMQAIVPYKDVCKKTEVSQDRNNEVALLPASREKRTMAQLLNRVLAETLLINKTTIIFGEDVSKKGGVYRITANLQSQFGEKRIFDTLLDEQAILGSAIGYAMNGFLPIPEIQFLAFIHNAIDQIRGEAATLSFFSDGQFTNPMIIRVPALAYQKGFGGHFHNENALAFLREIPGLVIICPSNGLDAVLLFRQALSLAKEQKRVVVFLEPIALYMEKDLYLKGDKRYLFSYPDIEKIIKYQEVGVYGADNPDLAIITYGNGCYLSLKAQKKLEDEYNITIKIIDLRWLLPLPEQQLIKELNGIKKILIVDECRKTGSLSSELMIFLFESLKPLPELKRMTAEDSFIPLGTSWKYLLPSVQSICAQAVELCDISVR